MALEYELTLGGSTPAEQVLLRALPDPSERLSGPEFPLSVSLKDRYGFSVSVWTGRDRYIAVESDDGLWEWEPADCTILTLTMDKFAEPGWKVINMLTVVRRVLETGPEDAVLVLNSDNLLLARFGGIVTKHRRDAWWSHYAGADAIIGGSGRR